MGSVEQEREYLYWLCRSLPASAVIIRLIWEKIGSFEQAYYIEGMELLRRGIVKSRKAAEAYDRAKAGLDAARREFGGLERQGIGFVTPLDLEYPERLRHIYDYPMGLWFKGALPSDARATAAIIGARNCTVYGQQAAGLMGRELAAAGVQVISGLALGVDGAGHRGALAVGGRTWGVLGCGINICYPKQNYLLFREMEEQGGILSEYPPGELPKPQHFPVRNRIISGLADAVLVGCAQAVGTLPGISRSGMTISAGMLRGYDRTFAVRFSFLMSLPAVFGATLLELKDALEVGLDPAILPYCAVGMVVAGVVGYFAIRLVNLLADKGKFGAFAYYCWAVGLVSLVAGFLVK